ncbi:MAG: hypothetical protein K0S55_160 [Clostridia bacterium]|nr:hypothetical protein [Clostridia bacterium]
MPEFNWFKKGFRCGNVTLSNIHRTEASVTTAPTVKIDEDVIIDRLLLSDLIQNFIACEPPLIVNNGTTKTFFTVIKIYKFKF